MSLSYFKNRKVNFNKVWKFYLGDDAAAKNENFNDAKWHSLNLPQDWSSNADKVELFFNGKSLCTEKQINDDLHVM